MTRAQLLKRIKYLEQELRTHKSLLTNGDCPHKKSFRDFVGMFHNDADFAEAMRLGAAYRISLRPKSARKPPLTETRGISTPAVSPPALHPTPRPNPPADTARTYPNA